MIIKKIEFKKSIKKMSDEIMKEHILHIALMGRSNVGKSSLINMLLGRKSIALTGKKPGKTKQINFFLANDQIYFVDLPGYGYSKGSLEDRRMLSKMIEDYFFQKVYKRKVILIIDAKVGLTERDLDVIDFLKKQGEYFIVVANKIDLLNQKEKHVSIEKITSQLKGIDIVFSSTKTKKGREKIFEKLGL